jgi:hypothetical protein
LDVGNLDFIYDLPFQGTSCNVGGGMDPDTGIFSTPLGGTYLFVFHIATHDNKKALLSIRVNGEEVASVFDQVRCNVSLLTRVARSNQKSKFGNLRM